ncbi:hypothetical protein DRO53_02705 [Candidatus Bathyarchaeota archaeon]|nr:MAG: hypothetical protein DRO53_02705 [Candidatus Bathyarchaeota archaeon]
MAKIVLKLKREPKVPIFAEQLTIENLAGKKPEEIGKIPLLEGSSPTAVEEFFEVEASGSPSTPEETEVEIQGDLSRFRYVGRGMKAGKLTINGGGGFYVGEEMAGGSITVKGPVLGWAGSAMKGGLLEIFGYGGDYLAAPYRGETVGMTGGMIIVHGDAGRNVGLKMAGGSIKIEGSAGEFLGHGMSGGEIYVGGSCGPRLGAEMKGGRIVVMGKVEELLPTFTYSELREKAKFAGEKLKFAFYVYTGDVLEQGSGKLFLARCVNKHLNPEGEIFPDPSVSLNLQTVPLLEEAAGNPEAYGAKLHKIGGATVLDLGVEVKPSGKAGELATKICLANMVEVSVEEKELGGGLKLPVLTEKITGHPALATLGSQFAGWAINVEGYFAMGSGPARALSLQPKKIYEKLCYRDPGDKAVLFVEADRLPTEEAVKYIAESCGVSPENLYLAVASTSSPVGSYQIAGRVVETGIHKLSELGFLPNKIISGWGSAPIAPVHPKSEVAMGITNDMILYGGEVYLEVDCKSDDEIIDLLEMAPSCASPDYGKPFYEIFVEAGKDFYKIDPGLFAPAKITITNRRTGKTYSAGYVNPEILKRSIDLIPK